MDEQLPYAGITVVELADDPAGERVGKLLADLGATVLKLEPPEGVTSRRTGPFVQGREGDPDASLAFWTYNTGKQSIVVEPSQRAATVTELARTADVLLTTAVPRELATEDWSHDQLREENPALVVLSVTPYGLTGPWADRRTSELVGLALGGTLNSCGYDDHSIPPVLPGGNQTYEMAASFAHIGLLLALVERQATGRGQLVDVSMHEANAVSGELANPYWFYPRAIVKRQTNRHAQPVPTQSATFRCADGVYVYFALILSEPRAWRTLVDWMTDHELAADLTEPAYDDVAYRQQNFSHVQGLVEVFFLLMDSETAYHEGQRRGLPIGPLRGLEDLPEDEHLRERGFFVEVEVDDTPATLPGVPYRTSAFTAVPGPPPRLGEHTAEVLADAVAR
ncbi:carnitine dehydratase [Nocardioides sp. Root190]|uniref:CaiB/BaiF CoA transferase family protein n=1 Tax=Nocardioides sp. Root190 TaxID=1736488 RepID=UPI0006FFB4EE|nr:CoA transferase [Nocardioides sp. Root190]KRB76355.1 carnitine dehydratase [Nocardioides sp. Root190]